MNIVCPNCGEEFEFAVDEDDADTIVDCEICCRPVNVSVRRGQITGITAA